MDNAVQQLAEKVAALEAKVDPQKRKPQAPKEPSLAECNAAYDRAHREHREEKRSAATMAKDAIDAAFRTGRHRVMPGRVQKPIAGHALPESAKEAAKK